MAIIRLENVDKVYRTDEIETLALENVNIEIDKGEFVSVMGPSGCGKSTLLNIIGLLDSPSKGEVTVRNEQPAPNVLDNVTLPLAYRHGVGTEERERRAREALERLGLSHRLKHFPGQLSGGQCQRVAIARAIIGDPEIVLADEPTGNLVSRLGQDVMDILHRLNREDGRTIVMVTHNENQARTTDRIIRFFDGRQVK